MKGLAFDRRSVCVLSFLKTVRWHALNGFSSFFLSAVFSRLLLFLRVLSREDFPAYCLAHLKKGHGTLTDGQRGLVPVLFRVGALERDTIPLWGGASRQTSLKSTVAMFNRYSSRASR